MIELDVFIPYYGDPDYLVRAVESVRALEDTDWRLTIVEDAYPDGPRVQQRIERLADDRIRYLRNERNLGTAGNYARCVQLAERELFLCMGSDDLLLPSYGRVLAGLLDRYPDAAMLQPAVRVIDEEGRPYRPLPDRIKGLIQPSGDVLELHGEPAVASLLRGNWSYSPALAVRRKWLTGLPERHDIDAVHDLATIVDILLAGGSLVVSREVGFQYRRHRNSHSSSHARNGERFVQEKGYFTDIEAELRTRGWTDAARAARQRLLSRFNALAQLPGAVLSGQRSVAGRLLSHALRR